MTIISSIISICKINGRCSIIVYTPLWETLKKKGLSTYTLRVKFQISGSTVQRLRKNMSVSTNTLDDLCNLLDCSLSEIAEHVPNEEQHGENTDNDV